MGNITLIGNTIIIYSLFTTANVQNVLHLLEDSASFDPDILLSRFKVLQLDPSSSFVPISLQRDVIVVHRSGEIRNTLFAPAMNNTGRLQSLRTAAAEENILRSVDRTPADRHFVSRILVLDEAIFTRNGIFNRHSQHVWAYQNPNTTEEINSQHQFSFNTWMGVIGNILQGPCELPTRLTDAGYLSFLQTELIQQLDVIPLATRFNMWLLQHGAPAHYDRAVKLHLDERFPSRWIGRKVPIAWPARSPDLTPCNFWFEAT
ncbi:hypothetical protein ANN_15345 [Periplaneta americana]|uniref:Uncharacterized protein n=1 Tax=Periplaneta americana TaxID=6978 RepID=A0ABQ8SGJ7_PERAM|nr:hypothetical protein ANN_15345 [Periplaneta americana]